MECKCFVFIFITILCVTRIFVNNCSIPTKNDSISSDSSGSTDCVEKERKSLAKIEDYPFIVTLLAKGKRVCGGSIIGSTVVIIAAHCVRGLPASKFTIQAGIAQIHSDVGVWKDLSSYTVHPKYDPHTMDYDVALLKLTSPLIYTNRIRQIKICSSNSPTFSNNKGYINGTAIGWGKMNMTTPVLKYIHLRVLSNSVCQRTIKYFTERMFCSPYDQFTGWDNCSVESGGPFVVDNELYGVSSFGPGCGAGAKPPFYTVYTCLINADIMSWVRKSINDFLKLP